MTQGLSCSAACGIFPDQGSNPCPLHWQADSQPLCHQGSPPFPFDKKKMRGSSKLPRFFARVTVSFSLRTHTPSASQSQLAVFLPLELELPPHPFVPFAWNQPETSLFAQLFSGTCSPAPNTRPTPLEGGEKGHCW